METVWQAMISGISPLELVAAGATIVNVYLATKNKISCWYWGIVSVSLYGYVFYQSRLYSSMGLQLLYYLPMQFYGWWMWTRGGKQTATSSGDPAQERELPITRLSLKKRLGWIGINLPLAAALGYLMSHTGAQLTYLDALATAMSVTAQYLLTHRFIENWVLWITIDVIYAGYLLPQQGLYVSVGLYVILGILSSLGLRQWSRIKKGEAK